MRYASSLGIVFLNPPYWSRLVRRYMCTYRSPNVLFPPLELLALAGMARERRNADVAVIDAIAEQLDTEAVCHRMAAAPPDLMVVMLGHESFDSDVAFVRALKAAFPAAHLSLIGYYPTLFPEDVLKHVPADSIILGEPDETFLAVYDAVAGVVPWTEVDGIARRDAHGQPLVQGAPKRIRDLDMLPLPAYDLITSRAYGEPFLPRPHGTIQTARGCPYGCRFCRRSFGRKLAMKSADRVLAEIRFLRQCWGIRSLRFIDDTFTVNADRVQEICRHLEAEKLGLKWSCLSRTDTVTDGMLAAMKRAGCRRIHFGIESGSQRILDRYGKGSTIERAAETLRLCRKHGIETVAFFMIGLPDETREEFDATIRFALRPEIDYYGGSELGIYPGTDLYEEFRDRIDFSLFPYKNHLKDPALNARHRRWKKEIYRRFYLRPGYLLRHPGMFLRIPESLSGVWALLRFLVSDQPAIRKDEAF